MSYSIKLPVFEGPFDLLLYLIKKNEVDIYDIPIAKITHQYLDYIKLMKMLDLDIAGEFIEVVATLMLIKVRMLLPGPETEGDEEPEDPRAALVAQLLEYKKFKDITETFSELERDRSAYYSRAVPKPVREKKDGEEDEPLQDVSLFDLLTAFKRALDNMPKVTVHQVNVIKVTIEQQVRFLFARIGDRPYALFGEVAAALHNKIELIVTFMALLDLMRLGILTAKQSDAYGEIRLVPLRELDIRYYHSIREQEGPEEAAGNPPAEENVKTSGT